MLLPESSFIPVLRSVYWLFVCQIIRFKILLLVHKELNSMGPKENAFWMCCHVMIHILDHLGQVCSMSPESKLNMAKQHSVFMLLHLRNLGSFKSGLKNFLFATPLYSVKPSFISCTALSMHCSSYFVFICCFCILPCVCFVSCLNTFMSLVKHSSSFIQKKFYILFDVCVFMWIPSRSFHPYANPEVLSFPVEDGSLAYMKWMDEAIPDD